MASSNYYLGQTPEEFLNRASRYFYGATRTADGFLQVTKVDLTQTADSVSLQNLNTGVFTSNTFPDFEEGVDFFDGVDATTKMPNYTGLNFEQYKWTQDDLYYYVDGDGVLSVRIDVPYGYAEGVVTQVLPELLLTNSTAGANSGQHILAGGYDLGTIRGNGNPLDNTTFTSLSFISDREATVYTLDMGTIA